MFEAALGLGLVAFTTYFSALSHALRIYSRARLAEYLSGEKDRIWLARLDRHETGMQMITSALRLVATVGLMVWVYYSAQILLFGAEFTQVYANRFGEHIQPTEDAAVVSPNKATPPDRAPTLKRSA